MSAHEDRQKEARLRHLKVDFPNIEEIVERTKAAPGPACPTCAGTVTFSADRLQALYSCCSCGRTFYPKFR